MATTEEVGTTADGRFCAKHNDCKVRRKDGFSATPIGCWKCKLQAVS